MFFPKLAVELPKVRERVILRFLVVVELKKGSFKPSYLGQLSHYLHVLDDDERLEGENPSVGIILCKDADRTFVEYVLTCYRTGFGKS